MTNGHSDQVSDLLGPRRTTLTTEVVDIIRQAIEDGRFESGEQLTESRLAKQFNISRAPVREALRRLESEGLVVHFPHRGYFVRTLTLKDVEEVFQLRTALERLAVTLLIERPSEEGFGELEQIVSEMVTISTTGDTVALTELDADFHEQLCKMSGNHRLLDVWRSMRRQIRIAVLAANASFPVYEGFAEGHAEVLEAIRSGDVDRAQSKIVAHIEFGLASLQRELSANEQ